MAKLHNRYRGRQRRHPNATTGAFRLLWLPRSAGIALADFIPVVASRRDPKSIHTTIRRRCNTSRDILDLIDDAFSSSFPPLAPSRQRGDSRELARRTSARAEFRSALIHYHNNLKLDIIDMARYVCTIHMFTEDEEPIKASYSLGTIQDDVDEIIRATGNMYLMSVQNTLTMIAHALHPVPIKLEDLPSSQADDADAFLADHCYSCSNNDSTRKLLTLPDADPDPLPEVANDPDPEPMDIVEDDLDNNGDANRDIGEPNEVPSAAIQQLVRLLPPLALPTVTIRQPLDAIHHHPFRMFQHFHHIPSRDLFFTEAMLMDTINGTIHLRDLPLCVRTSATISAFCINTLADPPELNIIRGLDKHFIHHILRHHEAHPQSRYQHGRPTPQRATRSQFLPRRTPEAFSDIDDAFHVTLQTVRWKRCAVAIIYALRLLYITHHRNYFNRDHGLAEHYYPDHLFAIAKEIKSTAAALSLLPDTTTFNLLPRFVHDAFDKSTTYSRTSLGHRSDQYYRDKLPYLQTEFELVQPYVTDYINSFPTPSTEAKEIASDRACELINVALFQHAIIHRMSKKRSKQPELNNNQVFIGNLPCRHVPFQFCYLLPNDHYTF
ncbi:hypothetical protein MHU86_17584 [Fragilaria crotonensis]|nr:hypothetical protein MHU86_17584 [Fragilaria crotonensis]